MRAAALLLGVLLSSAAVLADDRTVLFDDDVNYAAFKTFALRDAALTTGRPELAGPIAVKNLADAIRTALTSKQLTETTATPDLLVEFDVTSVDYGVGPFGRVNAVGPGRRGSSQISTVDFTEATLVIDFKAGDPRALVWRGVYRAEEGSSVKLAEIPIKGAANLLASYPPVKKR